MVGRSASGGKWVEAEYGRRCIRSARAPCCTEPTWGYQDAGPLFGAGQLEHETQGMWGSACQALHSRGQGEQSSSCWFVLERCGLASSGRVRCRFFPHIAFGHDI